MVTTKLFTITTLMILGYFVALKESASSESNGKRCGDVGGTCRTLGKCGKGQMFKEAEDCNRAYNGKDCCIWARRKIVAVTVDSAAKFDHNYNLIPSFNETKNQTTNHQNHQDKERRNRYVEL